MTSWKKYKKSLLNIYTEAMIAFEELVPAVEKPIKRPQKELNFWSHYLDVVYSRGRDDSDNEWEQKIKESQWECPTHGLPKYEKTDCVECNEVMEINVVLNKLITHALPTE